MRHLILFVYVCTHYLASVALAADSPQTISFETPVVRLTVSRSGDVAGLVDRQSGVDYAGLAKPVKLATLHTAKAHHPATEATLAGDRLQLTFGKAGMAEFRVASQPQWFVVEVLNVDAPDATSLDIIDLPLTLKADPAEPMAACVLALNLKTNVNALPQATSRLQATCYAKLGMVGAKVAVIVCPQPQLRDVMKQVVTAADELPHSPIGGPWALDAPANRESYILDCTGNTSEQQIDEWITMLRAMGISQIDFHCGRCLRFGDLTPHPEVHPRGMASVRAMNDKLHAAGMMAGLHTYAFFISKESPFVTPVPNRGLASSATFTLAEALTADAKRLAVSESTANVSAIAGFFVRNSVTLRVDDELIIFHGVRKQAPFGFDECERGAYGTKAAAHAAGAKAAHLKECFGLFVPDPDSPLWTEVIDRTARAYNEGGFDMIYLDALDGSDILGGGEWGWYYGSKFVFELNARLKKPALFEMSTFHHHLWYVRSRMGAWDATARGARPFIELHRMVNENCARMFLPPHLGWWAMHNWQGIQPERSFPETVEYLLNRCIADNCGLSFLAVVPPKEFGKKVLGYGPMIKQYEELRRSGKVSPEMRQRLGVPFAEYTLETGSSEPGSVSQVSTTTSPGSQNPALTRQSPVSTTTSPGSQNPALTTQNPALTFRFRPVQYDRQRLGRVQPAGNTWAVRNRFAAQPLVVRIEALMSAESYDSPEATVVEDFSKPELFEARQVPNGTTVSIEKATDASKPNLTQARLTVANRPAANPPWAMVGRKFSPCTNVKDKGLGFWIQGDGKGELLNVQLKSPVHAFGGVCDRYVKIDFTGPKYVELIEPESDEIPSYTWPYMPQRSTWATTGRSAGMAAAYPAFHLPVSYDQIDELNLWYNDLPTSGASCIISPIKALPLKPCKMRNPTITLGGKALTFPAELQSGQYLECRSVSDCKIYDPEGNVVSEIKPTGDWPELQAGKNTVKFTAEALPGPSPRAAVTAISRGEPM